MAAAGAESEAECRVDEEKRFRPGWGVSDNRGGSS
jgi:hypothetical protein